MAEVKTSSATIPLRVVIVGAGIGGIAAALALGRAGHDVLVLEEASTIREIGAGIQIAPNMYRILSHWSLTDAVRKDAVSINETHLRRWQNGDLLGSAPTNTTHGQQYVTHRADLHRILSSSALSLPNVRLQTSSTVVSADFEAPSVELSNGTVISADVVLGADGVKSRLREQLLAASGVVDKTEPTGDAAYRILIPREKMIHDKDLKRLIDQPVGTRWMGPGRHVMAYPIKGHTTYNVVLIHPDTLGTEESWTAKGCKKDVLKEYEGWDPVLVKLLQLIPEEGVMRWKLCTHGFLNTWTSGNFALMGDACHPMLPYVAQGSAQAVEDAATLAILLSHLTSKDLIPHALKSYESARKSRTERIQGTAVTTRKALHLPDGESQRARDTMFRKVHSGGENPDKWGDPGAQRFLWGWDAETVAREFIVGSDSPVRGTEYMGSRL